MYRLNMISFKFLCLFLYIKEFCLHFWHMLAVLSIWSKALQTKQTLEESFIYREKIYTNLLKIDIRQLAPPLTTSQQNTPSPLRLPWQNWTPSFDWLYEYCQEGPLSGLVDPWVNEYNQTFSSNFLHILMIWKHFFLDKRNTLVNEKMACNRKGPEVFSPPRRIQLFKYTITFVTWPTSMYPTSYVVTIRTFNK